MYTSYFPKLLIEINKRGEERERKDWPRVRARVRVRAQGLKWETTGVLVYVVHRPI